MASALRAYRRRVQCDVRESEAASKMNRSYGLVLLACMMLFATCMDCSEVQARQRGFFFAPFFAPWAGQNYRPAWRERYYAPSRKRKAVRAARATQSRKRQQAALLIPRTTPRLDQSI